MIIDTSALITILFDEVGRAEMLAIIAAADRRCVSTATVLETTIVLRSRVGEDATRNLTALLDALNVEVMPFDRAQLAIAQEAHARFGKGRHRAGLNFGDLFAYALAKSEGAPLLFKGADFSKTDMIAGLSHADETSM